MTVQFHEAWLLPFYRFSRLLPSPKDALLFCWGTFAKPFYVSDMSSHGWWKPGRVMLCTSKGKGREYWANTYIFFCPLINTHTLNRKGLKKLSLNVCLFTNLLSMKVHTYAYIPVFYFPVPCQKTSVFFFTSPFSFLIKRYNRYTTKSSPLWTNLHSNFWCLLTSLLLYYSVIVQMVWILWTLINWRWTVLLICE